MLYHFHPKWSQPRVRSLKAWAPGWYCLFFKIAEPSL